MARHKEKNWVNVAMNVKEERKTVASIAFFVIKEFFNLHFLWRNYFLVFMEKQKAVKYFFVGF